MANQTTIKIQNGPREVTMLFDIGTDDKMIEAIYNCINYPVDYPLVTHRGKGEDVILTAEYLKASLIIIIKPTA